MPLSTFHPSVRRWFQDRLGEPTEPQRLGWPLIRSGRHTLIAAPTGTGKTLAAFLSAIDQLLGTEEGLPDETRVLYVSPLKALGNDVRKNLQQPLREIREDRPDSPEVRVAVRTGDTLPTERASMLRRPPHILVTTPESLYLLLTSEGGRRLLETTRTVIVDEVHALVRDKRGSHLALSLERLEALTGPVQRIGLSATQKPIEYTARFLGGVGCSVKIVDVGHLRRLDLNVEVPGGPLEAVCTHEQWDEIYGRMATLIEEHRTTLIFTNTRRMAERLAARLTERLGAERIACHHGSLSRQRRLDAEQRLKEGSLRTLVATASLELGIDIGEVDLVIQAGTCGSIATLLQRVGRAGHGVGRLPKGRIFPLTRDELVEAVGLLRAVSRGVLDRTPEVTAPLDILAQQMVAAAVAETWREEELFNCFRRAWPYRHLSRNVFDSLLELHSQGRRALLHRDGVGGKVRATRRARLVALTSGGAIPDTFDYDVLQEPDGILVGTVNEDFAIESSAGDIFQLGNTSWKVLKIERGRVRVVDAQGMPPSVPFWLGEGPSRTPELSAEVCAVREGGVERPGLPDAALEQVLRYLEEGRRSLGAVPTQERVIAERFFDETGSMHLVLHTPFGGRINRAWGLALRKRFCRGFGFELQAAATEDAILLSLGPQHSFPLEEVFRYLRSSSARDLLIQALLDAPMFQTRWRWNVVRALKVERRQGGRKVPAQFLRMRAEDELVAAFPQVLACFETLPAGDLSVPMDHPLVRQTIHDCLTEAMDVDGFLEVLRGLEQGTIEARSVDTAEPSVFAHSVLAAQVYTFLDDAPLEERRTQAVYRARTTGRPALDEIGALDPEAVRRVREEAWPQPRDPEDAHESLLWMGYVADDEAGPWLPWLEDLAKAGRVERQEGRWFAAEAPRDPVSVMKGRLEALGPVFSDDPVLLELERNGTAVRCRLEGRQAWCDRRLLARIQRYTLDRLRSRIEPVSAVRFLRYLACWQHLDEEHHLEGPRGVAEVLRKLEGFEIPAASWEGSILKRRVRGYRPEWLDELTLSGEFVWVRLWGSGSLPVRATPICLVAREDLDRWLATAGSVQVEELSTYASTVLKVLSSRGAIFPKDLQNESGLLASQVEMGIGELISRGLVNGDSFATLRQLLLPPSRRKAAPRMVGRLGTFRKSDLPEPDSEFVARRLLKRYGVIFRRLLLREKVPCSWRELLYVFRRLELRGEIRGGRFVAGFEGEQYALPEAVRLLRSVKRGAGKKREPVTVFAADPLNLAGILTSDPRVSPLQKRLVVVAGAVLSGNRGLNSTGGQPQ